VLPLWGVVLQGVVVDALQQGSHPPGHNREFNAHKHSLIKPLKPRQPLPHSAYSVHSVPNV